MVTHVFWDWNGTLIDDAKYCAGIISEILVENGLEAIDFETYRNTFCFPVEKFYKGLGLADKGVSFNKASDAFIKKYQNNWRSCKLQKGAESTLKAISQRDIKQSIITAGDKNLIIEYVDYYGIKEYFESLIGTDDTKAVGKIDVACKYLVEIGNIGKQVMLVGDTQHDSEVASAMESSVLLCANGHNTAARLRFCGGPIIYSLKDVVNFI